MPSTPPRRGPRFIFASGSRPLEGYTIKRAIGRGGFGEVYYAVSDAGKEVALKLLTRHIEIERRGVQHCMNLKSPNLIAIHDLRTNEEGDSFVIMEYVAGPSLSSILAQHPSGLPTQEVRRWLKGLVEGVAYLHDHGIVHRDLKPANLFLEEGVVKIGDYGLSKSIASSQDSGLSQNVGTCYYMAPEISNGKYDKLIDIYAIGIILHEILTGRVPFDGESAAEVLMKHMTQQPELTGIKPPYQAIIQQALAKDPARRPRSAYDLLPPEDAHAAPEIRIIEKHGETIAPMADALAERQPSPGTKAVEDEPLVIEGEEPILYIGPETMPQRPSRWRRWAAQGRPRPQPGRVARTAGRRIASAPVPAVQRTVTPAASHRVPAPLMRTEPPELPNSQARLVELAGSMLVTAPLAGMAAAIFLPTYDLLGMDLAVNPVQLVYLGLSVLLVCWALIIPGKWSEGRGLAKGRRRLLRLGTGVLAGIAILALGFWTRIGELPQFSGHALVDWEQARFAARPAGVWWYVAYLGLIFAATDTRQLTGRDRRVRFRFIPVIRMAVVTGLIGLVFPAAQAWTVLVMTSAAIVAQVVSPWSEQAAHYAAEVRSHWAA